MVDIDAARSFLWEIMWKPNMEYHRNSYCSSTPCRMTQSAAFCELALLSSINEPALVSAAVTTRSPPSGDGYPDKAQVASRRYCAAVCRALGGGGAGSGWWC